MTASGSNGAYGGAGQAPAPDRVVAAEADATSAWTRRVAAHNEQFARLAQSPGAIGRPRYNDADASTPELSYLRTILKPSDMVLDVEATAEFSIPAARLTQGVVAFNADTHRIATLELAMREKRVTNIATVREAWPPPTPQRCQVALAAYALHHCSDIGPFLDAMELAASRTCVAILNVDSPRSSLHWLWMEVHREPYERLPALSEFITLLQARGCLFDLRVGSRAPVSYACGAEARRDIRAQLSVVSGSEKDERLQRMLDRALLERDDRFGLAWDREPFGVITWSAPVQ